MFCKLTVAELDSFQVLVAILPQTQMQYFDDEAKSWKPLPSMAQLTEATECSCAEYVGNYLYVAAKKGNDFVNYRYDTVSNTWETLPPVLSHVFSKSHIDSFRSVEDYLYAITSGSMCVPFRYSPPKNNWQGGASLDFVKKQFDNPNNRLTNATAAVWKSHIYVLHGLKKAETRSSQEARESQSNSSTSAFVVGARAPGPVLLRGTNFRAQPRQRGSFTCFGFGSVPSSSSAGNAGVSASASQVWVDQSAVLHRFDPKLNEWKQLSSTCRPHCNSGLFVVNNRLYVAEGCTQSGLIPSGPASIEVYDDGDDTWSVVEQKHIPLNNLGAVEIEGRVYFVINKFPVDSGIRIPPEEIYHVHLDEWENLPKVSNKAVLCYLPVKRESLKTVHDESQAD